MEPLLIDGDIMLINRIEYHSQLPERGDVIAMYFPGAAQEKYVKRIIGLPGETVEIKSGKVYINNIELPEAYVNDARTTPDQVTQLDSNEYFVMGDNRAVSSDSRTWGPLPKKYIIGEVKNRLTNKNQWHY